MRQQRAADAVAHHVDRRAAGDLAYRLARLQRAEIHVVLDGDAVHRRVGILPGHDEDGEALLHQLRTMLFFGCMSRM